SAAFFFAISEKFGYAIQATATRAIAMHATTANWPQNGSFLKSMVTLYPPVGGVAPLPSACPSGCGRNWQVRENVTPTEIEETGPRITFWKYRDPVRLL